MSFERVKAFPDGTVHFVYGDKIVTQKGQEPPIIRINTHRDVYGIFDGLGDLSSNMRQFGADELYDDFSTSEQVSRRNS